MRTIATGLLLAMAGVASPANAQMVDGPPGSTIGVFGGQANNPNRNSQTFDLNLDLGGGYDRDPNALQLAPALPGATSDSGWSAGHALFRTNYRVGHLKRSLDARTHGTVNYQGNTHVPLYGGGISLNGLAKLRRRSSDTLRMAAEMSYEPGLVLAATPLQPTTIVEMPALEVAPELGIVEQRWFITSLTSSYQHQWSPRHQSNVLVGARRIRPADNAGFNSEWQNAMLLQSWALSSTFDLTGSYRFDRSLQTEDAIDSEPVHYQTATAGMRIVKRFAAARRVTFSLAGGGTRLGAVPGASPASAPDSVTHPAVSLSLEVVASNSFSMLVSANRQVTILQGISPTPLKDDDIAMVLNGSLGRRLRITLTGSYMKGETIASGPSPGNTIAGGGNLSVRYGLKRWLGAFATYSYYQHQLENGLQAAAGLPPVYDRYSARAGFTLWLPLYGRF